MNANYVVSRLIAGEPKRIAFSTSITKLFYPSAFDLVSVNEYQAAGTIILPPAITYQGRTLIIINETGTNTVTIKDEADVTISTISTRGGFVRITSQNGSAMVESDSTTVKSGVTTITPTGTAIDGTSIFTNVVAISDSAYTCVLTLPNTSGIVAVINRDIGSALAVKIDGYAPQVSITAGKTALLVLQENWGLIKVAEEA